MATLSRLRNIYKYATRSYQTLYLFVGGLYIDAVQHTVITMSSASMAYDMSRYRSKVNSILYTCLHLSLLNGMLPHANALCVLRHEPQHCQHGRIREGREDGQGPKRKQPEMAGDSTAHQPDSPPPPDTPPCTSRSLRPLSLDLDTPACDLPRVPGSDTLRRLPGVSGPARYSGAHRLDTPA